VSTTRYYRATSHADTHRLTTFFSELPDDALLLELQYFVQQLNT
jgi:hypothetical protein